MQRFVSLCTGTSRLFQVVGVNHLKNSQLLSSKSNGPLNTNIVIFKRCLATKTGNIDTHPDLYKPSTAKQETHVPDDLKGGQSPETFDTSIKSPLADGKVWSAQNPGGIHVAPLKATHASTIVPKSTANDQHSHETTVYTTQGKLNIADPFKTHTLQSDATSAKLAESEAASAFDTYAPDTPLPSSTANEVVFAPKISSASGKSTTSSPTSSFGSTVSPPSGHDSMMYEMASKSKVFGGQDTTADTKKHPNENPFNSKEKIKSNQAK